MPPARISRTVSSSSSGARLTSRRPARRSRCCWLRGPSWKLPGPPLPVSCGRDEALEVARRAAAAYLSGDPAALRPVASRRSANSRSARGQGRGQRPGGRAGSTSRFEGTTAWPSAAVEASSRTTASSAADPRGRGPGLRGWPVEGPRGQQGPPDREGGLARGSAACGARPRRQPRARPSPGS